FHLAIGIAIDQRVAAGELAKLGEKLTRPMFDDGHDAAKAVAPRDLHVPGQQDEHARTDLPGLEKRFAIAEAALLTEPANPGDFVRRQRRKGLLITWKLYRRLLICLVCHR